MERLVDAVRRYLASLGGWPGLIGGGAAGLRGGHARTPAPPAAKERLRHGMARVLTKEEHSRQGLLVLVKELLEQRQAMRENSTARPNSAGGEASGVME